ncbi:MAG: histidinol dehydrogenase [Acidimicrobiaceae bacterium]|nr:histidinol dehydrogenase [Acidimicrobiaceae bacterium]MBT5580898.1 histidinol dehydrogenase [Acidimicrobiaceae bacterium]MBT5848880.1 histidinol dehydrogenase [Acidimicrobiaceae bacterium]
MLQRIDLRGISGELSDHLPRPVVPSGGPVDAVREILTAVRERGDAAIREFTVRFDGVRIVDPRVPVTDLVAALDRVPPDVREALKAAAASIEAYHRAQLPSDVRVERPGVSIVGMHRAVERVGCYVPGGRAVYPSTVLMTAVPARVAGVAEVVVMVPPGPDGKVPDVTLAAAAVAGVDEVLAIGGAQAIGAVAYGTETIRPVDVIVGPGNVFVALAKQEVSGFVGVPSSFAGPSEVVVVADGSWPATFAAVDLILQAEHGPDGLAWFVTWNEDFADEVDAAIERLVAEAPRQADIRSTLDASGISVICDSPDQALEVANFIAPEHLELQTEDPEALVPLVRHAGAVFCGAYAPASLGDYVAGPSHVLPTSGTARFASALTVSDFMKDVHVVSVDQAGFEAMGDHVIALAQAEGLDAHAASIRVRREAET